MSNKIKSNRIKLITNPGSGDAGEEAKKLENVTGFLEKNNYKVDVVFSKPKKEATPIARKASEKGYKIVVAMGGDGMIEAVMRGIIGSKTRLGIIPSGKKNNIAKSLGIPSDLEEACALIASDSTLKLDVGQVKTKKGKKFYFFEIATVGLSAAIYPEANKVANGKLMRIKDTAVTLFRHETKPEVYMTINDESKNKVDTMLVVVSNTPTFGLNFNVAPEASLQDGLLDISVYPEFSKVELLRYYAAVMNGGYSGEKKVQHYQARKLKIKSSPKLDVMADGIALGKGTVTIKVLPGALRVITNAEKPGFENIEKAIDEKQPEPAHKEAEENHQEKISVKVG